MFSKNLISVALLSSTIASAGLIPRYEHGTCTFRIHENQKCITSSTSHEKVLSVRIAYIKDNADNEVVNNRNQAAPLIPTAGPTSAEEETGFQDLSKGPLQLKDGKSGKGLDKTLVVNAEKAISSDAQDVTLLFEYGDLKWTSKDAEGSKKAECEEYEDWTSEDLKCDGDLKANTVYLERPDINRVSLDCIWRSLDSC